MQFTAMEMSRQDLSIMSWNVNGLKGRITDVDCYVRDNNIDVVALQETGDSDGTLMSLRGFQQYHLFSGKKSRGLSLFVRNQIPSELVQEPSKVNGIESICVRLTLQDGDLNIVNLYVHQKGLVVDHLPECLFHEPTLLVGDLNARHPLLGTPDNHNRNGVNLVRMLEDHPDACLLGEPVPTHVKGGRLDYACILNGEGIDGECRTVPDLLSDHFALHVELPLGKRASHTKRRRLILREKNREAFTNHMHQWWTGGYVPADLDSFYNDLVGEISDFLHPRGNGSGRAAHRVSRQVGKCSYPKDESVRRWNASLREARKYWLEHRTPESLRALQAVAQTCSRVRQEARSKHWQDFAETIGKTKNLSNIWREVNLVRGRKPRTVAHPDPEAAANELIHKWASAASASSLPPEVKAATSHRAEYRRRFIFTSMRSSTASCIPITQDELLYAISPGKSTSPGEDGVTYDILNCLASIPNGPLLELFNMSFREGRLPKGWKKVIIIPIPKGKGKFRPISLLSCLCKMMEGIILNRLLHLIGKNLSPNLYGFIKNKSTSDCLIRCLSNSEAKCRIFVDLEGAFDKVSRDVVLFELARIGVQERMLTWIGDYLEGRSAQVWFQGSLSEERSFELGTPQGGRLSPAVFNVVMNIIAGATYPQGVVPIVYADDILLMGPSVPVLQEAVSQLADRCRSLGLVINMEKTKYQSADKRVTPLVLNERYIEKVEAYKYLGVYVGYTAEGRKAEVNHLLTLCKARLQPLRALAWSGLGAGPHVLRTVYISTIRSLIDYAAPALSIAGGGRVKKLEVLQNRAMRAILSCQMNTPIESMRALLHLQSVHDRVKEINMAAAIRHTRGGGTQLALWLNGEEVGGNGTPNRYTRDLARELERYEVLDQCRILPRSESFPPWEEEPVELEVVPLSRPKSMHARGELAALFASRIDELPNRNCIHLYTDGSVAGDGRAGVGVLVREHGDGVVEEEEFGARVTDAVTSTQAELLAILAGLRRVFDRGKDLYFFVDSRSALESLNSRDPVYTETIVECRSFVSRMRRKNRAVSFMWIPSHVGLRYNERVDKLAKDATQKGEVEISCNLPLRQIRSRISSCMFKDADSRRRSRVPMSQSREHFLYVSDRIEHRPGKGERTLVDTVKTRLILGYKYYWQCPWMSGRFSEADKSCKVCGAREAHTLEHYILSCPRLQDFRNSHISNVKDQIVWFLRNGVVERILKSFKLFAPSR